ncbi:hypothetical protein [Catalinimonas niigatensis]|uniref:hypothetical protein n=1 Tax=Catalinimonas niigatensis TaxID=1397264 RepID=UPI00266625B4|nr:hypothetical protein [Catalinimonas niigatensis]WPP50821.1 hypothetical protein PZB72_00235 [Catalinimonas niigatensis]
MKQILLFYFTFSSIVLLGQKIVDFEYSSCIIKTEAYFDSVSVVRSGDYYQIKFKAYQNCIGNFESEINLINDLTLNFDIYIKGALENKEVEIALCDCLFEFDYSLTGIKEPDIQIRINGLSLKDYNKGFLRADMSIDTLIFEDDDPFGLETDSTSNQGSKTKQ